jgi:peptide/nickel transport system permease protein
MFGNLAASSDFRLLCLCVVLGLTGWTGLCRLVRGEVLKLRSSEFTLASRGLGMPSWRIILRHLLPNVMPLVLVVTVLDFSALVLAEAVLTYINIGIDPATPSWGNMINAARLELTREPVVWWSLAAAFLGMLGLVLPVNLLADVIRDEFDPRSRSQESQS